MGKILHLNRSNGRDKNLAKMKNKTRVLKLLIAMIVVFSIVFHLLRITYGTINEYISDLNIVYTPSSPARTYRYSNISIDIFEYWVFKLSDLEEKTVLNDIENGKWDELDSNHIAKLDAFDYYNKILGKNYKKNDCYICIYDCKNDIIITDSENMIYEDTTKWIIFLYDTETKKYYCIHETV